MDGVAVLNLIEKSDDVLVKSDSNSDSELLNLIEGSNDIPVESNSNSDSKSGIVEDSAEDSKLRLDSEKKVIWYHITD